MDLKKLRVKIDAIDAKILDLSNQRAQEVLKINNLKKKDNIDTFCAEREAKLLKRLETLNKGPLSSQDVDIIFREIISVCRSLNTALRVTYMGPQGTFSHLAAIKKFGRKSYYLPAESISDVFNKVEKGEAEYGVVPVENSTEGVINYTLDMFFHSHLMICSEITLNISHALLVKKPKNTIKRIYSNPQVLAQCRQWILRHYPDVEAVPMTSTAKAAQEAQADLQGACIGNRILAELYGLSVVASSIEDSVSNMTRFLVIAKHDGLVSGKDKTSLLFSIKDRVGALYDVLSLFKKSKINLTKIESRPSKKKPWEYYFFVDFEGHRSLPKVQKALKDLEKKCIFVKILGSYPKEK